MTSKELVNIIQGLINEIQSFAPEWHRRAGNDMAANILRRVTMSGQNADGGSFSPYSSAYANYRRKSGRTSNQKVFNFTGELWRNFGVTRADFNGFEIGGYNQYAADLFGWLSEKEGAQINKPSETEIQAAKDFLKQRLKETLNRYL